MSMITYIYNDKKYVMVRVYLPKKGEDWSYEEVGNDGIHSSSMHCLALHDCFREQ